MSAIKPQRIREGLRNGKRVKIDMDTDEIIEVLGNAVGSYYGSPSHDYNSGCGQNDAGSSGCSSDSGGCGGD